MSTNAPNQDASVLTVKQLAARWQVKPDTVRALILAGKLRAFDVALANTRAQWRVPVDAVDEFERNRRLQPATAVKRRRRAPKNEIEFFR